MLRIHLVSALGALTVWTAAVAGTVRADSPPELVASTSARTPAEERKAFRLPDGFVAELVASEPDIHKPLNLAFDDQGRLWVTDTIEYPFPAPADRVPRDSVKVLSDFGPDGRARSIVTFADKLNIPIGLLPLPSGREALVHSIPEIWRLTDSDGDGKADRREPVYRSYGFRDTHGMTNAFTWGFDGWIYACHGFANESKVEGADKNPIIMQSGNTYRMRPDGSHAEYVTHGQVNPFGLAFDPLGNLYSCDCHSRPIYQLLRGAWYPSFGKPHDGLGFGPEMCFHDHGSTGIAGIVYYAADQFPRPFRDNVFIGNVVTSRINRDTIAWTGSSPRAVEQPDLLVSDDPWFRPVDLELGPDGAIYVADFYNKIIGHYEVPLTHPGRDRERGRIWRIVYKGPGAGPDKAPRQDFSRATSSELLSDLGHANLAARMKATTQLAARTEKRPTDSLDRAVTSDSNPDRRVHALWVLERWNALADDTLKHAITDADHTVRTHAMKLLGERASLSSALADAARNALGDSDPFVRRAAAETLGRHPRLDDIRPLLALRGQTPLNDTHLVHVVRMALRDELAANDVFEKLISAGLTDREWADLADVATGIPSEAAASFLLAHIQRHQPPLDVLVPYVHHVARHVPATRRGELTAFLKRQDQSDRGRMVALLKASQQGTQERGAAADPAVVGLAETLGRALLQSNQAQDRAAGIELASLFHLTAAAADLTRLAGNARLSDTRRIEALAALTTIDASTATGILTTLLSDPAVSLPLREQAAELLAKTGRAEGQVALLAALVNAPGRVQSAIAAGLAARRDGAVALLDAVAAGKASARLLQDARVAGPLRNAGVPNLATRLDSLMKGLPPADQRINDLIARRRARYAAASHSTADVEAGAKIFETHCIACHQLGGKGAKVGPQLDGIGGRGPDRLMEDMLDPSRNVDQAFRLTTLALKDGRVVSGLLLREEGAVLVMADNQGKEVRVPAESVEERTVAPLSPMPANFSEQIPEADFFRLLSYLLSKKVEPK